MMHSWAATVFVICNQQQSELQSKHTISRETMQHARHWLQPQSSRIADRETEAQFLFFGTSLLYLLLEMIQLCVVNYYLAILQTNQDELVVQDGQRLDAILVLAQSIRNVVGVISVNRLQVEGAMDLDGCGTIVQCEVFTNATGQKSADIAQARPVDALTNFGDIDELAFSS